jgi:hypothetical protein
MDRLDVLPFIDQTAPELEANLRKVAFPKVAKTSVLQ